jgi:hypothetical protein
MAMPAEIDNAALFPFAGLVAVFFFAGLVIVFFFAGLVAVFFFVGLGTNSSFTLGGG